MNRQAIILAGGLGTRLRSAVPDLPKCMAPVHGRPFIHFVIKYLKQQGVDRFIFSLGYMHEVIEKYIQDHYPELEVEFSVEKEPLGTGGAIKLACSLSTEEDVVILNGDTMFEIDLEAFLHFHHEHYAACTLGLKPMVNFERYGVVEIDQHNLIRSFKEKKHYERGLINGGVYALHVSSFLELNLPDKFSFEKDYLEVHYNSQKMMGIVEDQYFIDIGIPEDYLQFTLDKKPALMNLKIDDSWTLFLDRDGVINHEKHLDYIHTWDEFKFYDGVKEAMKIFNRNFHRIVVVTNQKGVGKGLTKPEDLHTIHANMKSEIERAGGRIDEIYFCSDLDNDSPFRKPNPGMGLKAVNQFPDIDLTKSIMVGNTLSDMEFGRNLGIYTVFLPTTRPEVALDDTRIDIVYNSLIDFANHLSGDKL